MENSMREILFKAKRLDNGEWVEGNLIQTTYFGEVRSWISTPSDPTRLRAISTYYGDWRAVEVHTDTICQYTGLTDKNGNKIWENDILSYENTKGIIKFKDGCFLYKWKNFVRYRSDFFKECILKNFGYFRELGVIGNFFDNQDLLQ